MFTYYGLSVSVASLLAMLIHHLLYREDDYKLYIYQIVSIPFALIVSRLLFLAVNYSFYFTEMNLPKAMLYFWDGGYSSFGVILAIVLLNSISLKFFKFKSIYKFINTQAICLLLFMIGIRFAEQTIDLGIGKNFDVDITNFIFVKDSLDFVSISVSRLDIILNTLVLIVLIKLFASNYQAIDKSPFIMLIMLASYSSVQIVLQSLRNDGHMLIGFVHVEQVLYAFVPLFCLLYANSFYKQKYNQKNKCFILNVIIICIILLLDIYLEFVLDGRLSLPFNNLSFIQLNNIYKNYIIMSLASLIMIFIISKNALKLKKEP